MLVDIHTHNTESGGFSSIQNITFSLEESFLTANEKGFFSIGFHPWFADIYSKDLLQKLEIYAAHKQCVAIGECGLDKYSKVPMEQQVVVFGKQIRLSEKLQKPLIIHCVGCFNQLFELKYVFQPKQLWIIHGFRGKPQLARQALNVGCALSFGERYNAASVIVTPIDKLYLETDESKLSIEDIYQNIANLKSCKMEDLIAGERLLQHFGA